MGTQKVILTAGGYVAYRFYHFVFVVEMCLLSLSVQDFPIGAARNDGNKDSTRFIDLH